MASTANAPEPIAVVGIGCRFPGGADRPSKLWEQLQSPRELARRIPSERWSVDKYYHPVATHHGTTNVRESYFLDDDLTRFDAQFFSIGAAEAEAMDPQHRLLLEVVYEAMEAGGYTLSQLQGSDTAVYVGMMCTDYYATALLDANQIPTYAATGIATSNASSRISYHFDFHGPSMTIDTACSSSLVAIHHAVDQLRLGRSRVAVASGTNLLLTPVSYISESNLLMLSPSGRSRMWSDDADGYARGDGIATLLLKRLSDAIADGDEIRGIIRHTGFSHDGRTKGITMPSGQAQGELIKKTYAEAGLDITSMAGRPQFIEAHGTGTPVGDPQEASALQAAFFPDSGSGDVADSGMFVGSIKTVVGHTEGTAGVAGVIKACLALENAQIPPNLLFNKLAPGVAPFARHFTIPEKKSVPWPEVPAGQPRRVSVNSFGFGGTDAHAIVESFESSHARGAESAAAALPFTFSASSESSLNALLGEYQSFLSGPQGDSVDLGDLGYTLACRRSVLNYKVSFSASTVQELRGALGAVLENSPLSVSRTGLETSTNYLGIFTGQGAQWARMGHELITASPLASGIITRLEESLQLLPPEDRPTWSLRHELAAAAQESRISSEAEISQPLCTALQIVLVDLLRLAGIRFSAVVGHSSGEMAAAYAAGFISSTDAFRIAYYRGLCTTRDGGQTASGEKGGMLAVGTSVEDAQDLCEAEDMQGRITVAAINSPSSVTLSGDLSAIAEAKATFDSEGKFCRQLRVDKAYHSHHMLSCASAYRAALDRLKVEVRQPDGGAPSWFSSVDASRLVTVDDALGHDYWVRNMTNPVLFSDALTAALGSQPLDVCIEVGPHPALKGPAAEVIQAQRGGDMAYFGTCQRGKHDVVAMSEALGGLWALRGPATLRLRDYQGAFSGRPARLLTELPKYTWDHSRGYWAEPRTTRNVNREQGVSFHDLLGQKLPDGDPSEWRWTNVLTEKELPWLSGHALQGQAVFPTTGYVVMAVEASMLVAGQQSVQLLEILDMEIVRGLPIPSGAGVEVVTSLSDITTRSSKKTKTISARFTISAPPSRESAELATTCTAEVRMTIGDSTADVLPARQAPHGLQEVDTDSFYEEIARLGFGYSGPFRAVTRVERKLHHAAGSVFTTYADPETSTTQFLMHPATLDSALHCVFAAYSYPGDDRLWTLHAPTHIDRVALVPGLCGQGLGDTLDFDCICTDTTQRNRILNDVDIYTAGYASKVVSIEGLALVPLAPFQASDDRCMFSQAAWCLDGPDGEEASSGYEPSPADVEKACDLERILFYYIREAAVELHKAEAAGRVLAPHWRAAMRWVDHLESVVTKGDHPVLQREWLQDEKKTILAMVQRYDGTNDPDVNMARIVGEALPAVIRDDGSILEHMIADGALDKMTEMGLGQAVSNIWTANMVKQVAERHPQMNIIEIGAGTGGTTKPVVAELDHAFASYTFTDISSGFFPAAQKTFAHCENRMEYKTLDISTSPSAQGFDTGCFDMAIAANVLHATPDLRETLRNTRSLLKPGGWLVLMEIIDKTAIRYGGYYFGVSGWWIGAETGRPWGPTITLSEWDTLMKETGFAGIETYAAVKNPLVIPGTCFIAQAVDDDFRLLRQPLQAERPNRLDRLEGRTLVLVSTAGPNATHLAGRIQELMADRYDNICRFETLDQLVDAELPSGCTVLGLGELDEPMFKALTSSSWEGFKKATTSSSIILWLTLGVMAGEEPFSSMVMGCFRSIQYELSQSQFQILDVPVSEAHASPALVNCVAEALLRLEFQARLKTAETSISDTAGATGLKGMLWTTEPQLAWDGHRTRILRLKPDQDMNDRYNSAHRRILKVPGLESSPAQEQPARLKLEWQSSGSGAGWMVSVDRSLRNAEPICEDALDLPTLNVDSSVLPAIWVSLGGTTQQLYLVLGENQSSGQRYLYFSTTQASMHSGIKSSHAIQVAPETSNSALYLSYAVAFLLCEQLVSVCMNLSSGASTLIVNEPDTVIAAMFFKKLKDLGSNLRVVYTTSNPVHATKRNWVLVHPQTPQRMIRAKLSPGSGPVLFVDMSATPEGKHLASRICSILPASSPRLGAEHFLCPESSPAVVPATDGSSSLAKLLAKTDAFAMAILEGITDGTPLPVSAIGEVSAEPERFTSVPNLRVVNWRDVASVPVEVEPADRRRDLFSGDVTYWLVGLAGDVGRSLCDWMAENGARYIVLSSRNPDLPLPWLEEHRENGRNVAAVKCDVVSLQDVQRAKHEILDTLRFPPIKGVANGAMVLRDRPMVDTSYETLREVLGPKVDGTLNLDRAFSGADGDELDWFIVLSSVIADIGNFGQMAYSSANCFQKAHVQRRRNRGAAGSSIDIGSVVGVGYVTRETATGRLNKQMQDHLLRSSHFKVVSEVDLRHMFAEAVLAGRPRSGRSAEVITGLRPVTTKESQEAVTIWARNPTFAHFVRNTSGSAKVKEEGQEKDVSKMIAEAQSRDEVFSVVLDAFLAVVGTGLSAASIDKAVPLIDLGVDSLVAVLLRDWAQKELGVNLPVLKILGGDNAVDLVEHMVDSLVPEGDKDAGEVSEGAKAENLPDGKQNGHAL